jgi:RNA polymerase sigma factor (sigma-70 family)
MRSLRTGDLLSEGFEAHRPHLRAVAYRMLGSLSDADDAVQNVWLDLSRADTDAIRDLGRWLTTVVARVCLDMLRSRTSRREQPFGVAVPDWLAGRGGGIDPAEEAVLADSVGLALLVVMETLTPSGRVAFVLHDLFDLSYEEIATIVGRSPSAARQLASRARRRVRGNAVPDADVTHQRAVVDAFLAAARGGRVEELLAVLDPDALVRADAAAVRAGASSETRGAAAIAEVFVLRPFDARSALLDGSPGLVWAPGGRTRAAFRFTVRRGRVVAIDLVGEPERLRELEIVLLDR